MIITFMIHTTQTEQTAIARRHDTAGPLADASISCNTRGAYLGALVRLDAWLGTAPVDDAALGS